MPQFDQDKMIKLVSELRNGVNRLRHLTDLSQDDFVSDPDKIGSAKNRFIVAIENAQRAHPHCLQRGLVSEI